MERSEPNAGTANRAGWGLDNLTGRWQHALAVAIAAVCWTSLRFACCHEASNAFSGFRQIYDFAAPVPFGKRILTAWFAHALTWTGMPVLRAFETLEFVGAVLLAWGLQCCFRPYLGLKGARVAGLAVFGILPLAYVLCTPFALLYPWDIWAMALLAWGIHFLFAGRWWALAATMGLASFNRESAILLPMLCAAVYADRRPWWRAASLCAGLLAIHAVCQWLVGRTLADNPANYDCLFLGMSLVKEEWPSAPCRLLANWAWLNGAWESGFVVLGAMGGLPVWFVGVAGRLPGYLRRFGLVAWVYLGMLAVVGNLEEVRIYGETMVILFVPAVLGIWDSLVDGGLLAGPAPGGEANGMSKWMGWLEAVAALLVVTGLLSLGWAFRHGWKP